MKSLLGLALAATIIAVALCPTSGRADDRTVGVSMEAAAIASRALVARRDIAAARALIRATNSYESGTTRPRPLPVTHADPFVALLATRGGKAVDWLIPDDDMRARIRDVRILVDWIRKPDRMDPDAIGAAIGQHSCAALLDITAIRPAEALQIVRNALANDRQFDAAQKRCLARAMAGNAELHAVDLPALGRLRSPGDDATLAHLIQSLAARGAFAQALALVGEAVDPVHRTDLQRGVVAMRQLESIALPEADLLKSLWTNARRRPEPENLLFGALLAMRAPTEFWIAEAAAVRELVAARGSLAIDLVSVAARRAVVGAPQAQRLSLWGAVPAMRPPLDFVVFHAALTDPRTDLAIPPGTDGAVARAIRVARAPGSLFPTVLSEFPASGAGALDIASLVIAAIGAKDGD